MSNNSAARAGDMLYGSTLSAESMKVIAESLGLGSLPDDAAKELAEDVSFKIKMIIQDATKFMNHGRRDRLLLTDIDQSLKVQGIEPLYGFQTNDFVPFRFASGGGRELYFTEDRELDLVELVNSPMPKLPLEPTLRAHWLAVDGVQPTVPENPPPLSREMQALESVNPVAKLEQGMSKDSAGKPATGKIHKLRNVETVHVKQLATHELSVEQQLYYKEITEACVGSDEPRRGEALQSLACDPGLHEMLPRMCTFIAEGVKVNVVQNNLALLIYLMRMVKALLDNSSLYLEKYLHELIPSVTTCIVSKQLCMRPELDNHWALRDFASRLMAQICKTFNTSTNNLQTRVTRIFSKALQNDKTHLSSLYGSIAGLSELGGEVIKVFIISRLKFISERIEGHLTGVSPSNTDKTAAGHIRAMLQKCCPPILKQMRPGPDFVEEYKTDFGFLGPSLCQAVIKARATPSPLAASTTSIPSSPITSAAQTASVVGRTQVVTQMAPQRQTSPVITTIGSTQLRPIQQAQMTTQASSANQTSQQQDQQTVGATSTSTTQPALVQAPQKFVYISQAQASSASSPLATRSPHNVILQQQPLNSPTGSASGQSILITSQTTEVVAEESISGGDIASGLISTTTTVSTTSRNGIRTAVDTSSILMETEEIRPPPELDDLSHLE